MRERLAGDQLAPEARTNLEFALATSLEGLGDYDSAFEHFRLGNESMRRCLHYDTRVLEAIDQELMRVFSRAFLQQHAGTGNPDPAPIFIVGMPRSGSTLLEQILASHSLVDGTHELPELNRMVRSMGRRDGELKYPRALLAAAPARFHELGSEYLERTPAVAHRRTTFHRQDVEQFPARRADLADPAQRPHHQRAPPSARQLHEQLQDAVLARPEVQLRPARAR
jgi:hypothetical protein